MSATVQAVEVAALGPATRADGKIVLPVKLMSGERFSMHVSEYLWNAAKLEVTHLFTAPKRRGRKAGKAPVMKPSGKIL